MFVNFFYVILLGSVVPCTAEVKRLAEVFTIKKVLVFFPPHGEKLSV